MSFGALVPPVCDNCKGKYLLKYERDNPSKKGCDICKQPTGNDLINVCDKCVYEKGICRFCKGPLVPFNPSEKPK